jgi:hypothetical protein
MLSCVVEKTGKWFGNMAYVIPKFSKLRTASKVLNLQKSYLLLIHKISDVKMEINVTVIRKPVPQNLQNPILTHFNNTSDAFHCPVGSLTDIKSLQR